MKKFAAVVALLCGSVLIFSGCGRSNPKIKQKHIISYKGGHRYEKDGWICIQVNGKPISRGEQYGYLISDKYLQTLKCIKEMTFQITGADYSYFATNGIRIQKNKIPRELIDEMKGIAIGLTNAGIKTTLDDVIAWQAWVEMFACWWQQEKANYQNKARCSAFIATGNATKDREIVMVHSTFDDFWNVQWGNIILDINPSKGNRVVMQTMPGYIASTMDYYINSAGVMALETDYVGFKNYNSNKTPLYVRSRMAIQYGNNIDEFVSILNKDNNGGLAASWLIGDANTNEIAKFEQGYYYQDLEKKKDGYFYGCNVSFEPQIRNLECSDTGFSDIRKQTGARRVRLAQVIEKNYGNIDVRITKKIIADHFDVYSEKNFPSGTTICAHSDNDPKKYMSSQTSVFPDPYMPGGAVDAKITTSKLAKQMKLIAIFGRPCGIAFDARKFLKKHPQWKWQEDCLNDRKSQSWSIFPKDLIK
jgi:hypothetical protein